MKTSIIFLLTILIVVNCRDAKWFFLNQNHTTVVYERKLVTEIVPSSCVVVDPSLAPCRNIRQLQVLPTPTIRMKTTKIPEIGISGSPRSLDLSTSDSSIGEARSWSDWSWNDNTPAVTKTLVQLQTVRRSDPNVVVTVSVKGCRPSRLPFDLPFCKNSSDPSNSTHHTVVYSDE